jgi:hypothetical protein
MVMIFNVETQARDLNKESAGLLPTHLLKFKGYQQKSDLLYQQEEHSSQCSIFNYTNHVPFLARQCAICSFLAANCTDLT